MAKVERDNKQAVTRATASAEGHRTLATFLLLFMALALVLDAVAGELGWRANRKAQQEYDQAYQSLEDLRRTNAELRDLMHRLKYDPQTIEDVARREQGFIRPGEKLFILRNQPAQAK